MTTEELRSLKYSSCAADLVEGFEWSADTIDQLRKKVAELQKQVEKLSTIVRARTHRENGCLCERCVETEYDIAEKFEKLREELASRTARTSSSSS